MLGRPGLRAVPDERLGRDVDIAWPDEGPLRGPNPAEDRIVHGNCLEDGPGKEIGQVALDH